MAKRKVVLLARGGEVLQTEEGAAAAAITPGMLIARNSSGNYIPHGTAAATHAALDFAMERDEMGKSMDTAYAIGDRVKVAHLCSGERVNALIANGVNVAIGAALESAGNGTLRAVTTGAVLGYALEAVNNTSGANARLRVAIA